MTARQQTFIVNRLLPVLPLVLLSAVLAFLTLVEMEIAGLAVILAVAGAVLIAIRPQIGILVFLTTFFVTYGDFIPTQGRFTPNNLLGILFSLLLIVKVYREKSLSFLKERVLQVLFVLFVFQYFSSHILERQLFNPFPQLDGTAAALHDLTTRFAFLVFFVNFIRTLRDVKLVLWGLLAIIFLSGVSGAINTFLGTGFGIGGYRAAADWGISAAGNANRLAFFCVVGIALSWYYKRAVRSRVLSLLLTAGIPILSLSALLTASRSGLLNLFVVFGLLIMEGRFSVKRQLNLVLVVAVIVFLASDFLSDIHVERLGNIPLLSSSSGAQGTSSTEKRLDTLADGWKIFVEDPLTGVGVGNFRWIRLERFGVSGPPHNSYLWAVAEGGAPALMLYLLLFWLVWKRILQAERKSDDLETRLIAGGLRTAFISLLFFSLFADFWLNIMTYVVVGLAVVLGRLQAEELPAGFGVRANHQAASGYANKQLWAGV